MKNIETSICITKLRQEKIISAAKTLGVTVTDVLGTLMRKTRLVLNKDSAILWRAVQYQKRSPVEKYYIWHVSLEPKCYEFGVSERIVFKVSVSSIYATAIDLFLDEIIKNGLNSTVSEFDLTANYFNATYDIAYSYGFIEEFWIIKWDKRIKKPEKITLE